MATLALSSSTLRNKRQSIEPCVFLCSAEAFFARFLTAGNSWRSLLTVSSSKNTIEWRRMGVVCAIVFTVSFPLRLRSVWFPFRN